MAGEPITRAADFVEQAHAALDEALDEFVARLKPERTYEFTGLSSWEEDSLIVTIRLGPKAHS